MELQKYPFSEKFGWVQDRYGVSWQIVPSILGDMITDTDSARSNKVMAALMKMQKLDIKTLQKAYGERTR